MAALPPTTTAGPEALLDLSRLVAGIRWRRRTWLSCALAGLLLGVATAVLLPAGASAAARILVVHEVEAGDVTTLSETDVALFETTTVAAAALRSLGTDQAPEQLVRQFSVEPIAGGVLELTVSGRDDADAVARAGALADAFVADHVRRSREAADAEAGALLDRRAQAENQLDDLNDRISDAATLATTPDATAQLESLYAARAALNAQVQELGQRAEDASIGAPRVEAGTQVVDAPRAVSRSATVTAALNAVLGLVLGLAVGLALATVAAVVRDRPMLRRDIAAHLGASVIAQVPAPVRGLRRLWSRTSAATERRRAAATLARTVRSAPDGLSLLEIGCPGAAAALAVEMADDLAADRAVTIVDDLPGRDVGRLPHAEAVTVVDGTDPPPVDGELRIGVGSVGPGTAWLDLARLGAETLLVVRAGAAEAAWLHDVARQLVDARILVVGVVLVHPDPRDRTDGTVWDGLHTALRGRASALEARAARDTAVPAEPAAAVVPGTNGTGTNGTGLTGTGRNGTGKNGTARNGNGKNGTGGNGRTTAVDVLAAEVFEPDVDATPDKAVEDS